MKNRFLGIAEAVLTALVVLAGAIALPVLLRPFYFLHIGPLDIESVAELTADQIKTAYNEMMDFCIGITDTFSAGVLPFSREGASHFADVRRLFLLDLWVFVAAAVLLTVLKIAAGKSRCRLMGHTPGFWSAVGMTVTFVLIAALAAMDFDRAFTVFHKLFFPGKENWLFDPSQDPIILMLPWEFFRNCAILIFAAIVLCCGGLLLQDRRKK